MTAPVHRLTATPARLGRRHAAIVAFLLTAGLGLLAAGCSSAGPSAGGTSAGKTSVGGAAAPLPERAGTAGRPANAAGSVPGASGSGSSAAGNAGLTALPLPGGQAVIFTATLSLRAADVQATVARATQLAVAAGGYVSGEHASMTQSRHARALVSIQFKVPAAVYQSTLSALGGLGAKRSETQQAQDVTGAVADVNSRVTSAQAAITQLRKLLTRTGSVGGLLTVQEQINAEEATLEALQSQQRALARETTYATISMTITGPPPPRVRHHPHAGASGFLGGLAAGWRALRVVVAGLLTLAGALLPFAIPLALVALAAVGTRRWLGRRRSARARPAG
jgi:Domain of unknown function (DUF4349)